MPLHLRGLWVVAAVVASIFAAPLVVGGASAVAAKQSNHRPSWTAKPSMDGLSPASPPTAALTATGPSTPVLDDFNRADESPLTGGGNWAELNPFLIQEDLELVNNHVEEIGGCCPGLAARYWTPAVFGPDVEVHARMTSPNLGTGIRLSLRISNPDGNSNGYELVVSHGSPDRWLIRRYSNGFVDAGVGLAAPIREFVLFRAIGNTMEGLGSDDGVNWDSIITWSDSLYQVAGPISIAFDGGNGQQLDDFGGGTLGSPPPGGSQPAQQTFGQFGVGRGPVGNNATATFADPVNTLTGAFVHAETDLALASTGVPFEWTRTYTSADLASGRFGQGWTDTYQASVEILANGDAVVKGDDGQRFTFPSLGGGVFETPPAAMATLETVAGGYQLTTNDQLVYVFDSAGKLLSNGMPPLSWTPERLVGIVRLGRKDRPPCQGDRTSRGRIRRSSGVRRSRCIAVATGR